VPLSGNSAFSTDDMNSRAAVIGCARSCEAAQGNAFFE
jgi:hypothetical protein